MGMNAADAEAPEAAVKYRLVEAEEVNDKPHAQTPATRSKPKSRKGKLNWSQFPAEGEDAAPEGDNVPTTTTANAPMDTVSSDARRSGHQNQHQGRGRGPRSGRFNGRRHQEDSHGSYYNGVYVPTPDLKVTAQWAKNQIEFYLSSDNLVRDIFLRQHMDVDGFVPLAFVGSFQAVYSVHQDYASLLEAMKDSETIELDEQNEKIRLREGWQKWVWPNAEGGYGLPRYIKLAEKDTPAADDKTAA